ncbi:hypothetical protein ACGE0T_11985 [Parabacteroides sp. APC149_11_2_Y6]
MKKMFCGLFLFFSVVCSKAETKSSSKGDISPLDRDFTTIFQTDSACLQGYINRYSFSWGVMTGMLTKYFFFEWQNILFLLYLMTLF